jgi:glyoxylase-like metal-dependent hydrolase (beta-lactamase superfamily II)
MAAHRIQKDLWLIGLDQEALPGFEDFIGAWLSTGGPVFLVDPGPAASVPALAKALQDLGVTCLDAILLTHIHLDHAGGAGDISALFPDSPVVVHTSGIPHLADPARLWEGSLKTLGNTARAYGPLRPVPAARLKDAEQFRLDGLRAIPTPGHAPHHVSYLFKDILFAGEATGVCFTTPDGRYLRPATPPRFHLPTGLESLEKARNTSFDLVCFGHFGASADGRPIMDAHATQLRFWESVIREELARRGPEHALRSALERLLAEDENMAPFQSLPEAARARETGFLTNSVQGFIGYLESQAR